jgi:thiol-disulfide isomerase/thioredoxin
MADAETNVVSRGDRTMTDPTSNRRDGFTTFLVVACVALAALTVLLAWQNRRLKTELATALSAPPAGALRPGDTVPPFDVVDASGKTSRVAFDGHGSTLLLVFSSTCGACRETLPVWNRLVAEGTSGAVHVVGLQTDFQRDGGGDASTSVPDLRFDVFGAAEPEKEPMTKFPAIPAAALIDGNGAVKSVWFGVPTDAQITELHRAIAG